MTAVSTEAFARFRQAVLADPRLQRHLLGVPDARDFAAVVVGRARALGLDVDDHDVEEAIAASRQEWLLRWI